jgi:DNA-binding NarL/FixJ family response regulator
MRVVIVGRPRDRDRLRPSLVEAGLDVAGEAPTLAAAREAAFDADAFVVAAARAEAPVDEALTPREIDVLRLVSLGLPNKGIAIRLGISDQTVKFHVASIIGKLGATNRTDTVRRAVRRGLIDL